MQERGLLLALLAAQQNILHGFSCLERDGGAGSRQHAPQLRELARQQAIHGASDTALQEAQARRMLEVLLEPTQPLRRPAREALGLTARPLGRPLRLLPS